MKTVYIKVTEDNRIDSLTEEDYGFEGYEPFEVEDDFDVMTIDDYHIDNGSLVYDGVGTQNREQYYKTIKLEEDRKVQLQNFQLRQAQQILKTTVFTTDTQVADVYTILPDWDDNSFEYKRGMAFQWNGDTYRVSQDLTSTSVYLPNSSESLYYKITIADDGIIVYRPARGQYDSVMKGELRHYPDANGSVYRSKVDYNAYSPEVQPNNWELV